MAKTTKPTKQQIAQAKARAGGNNPVKVTNADLKKLGSAAVMAASFTPVGRVAKVVATVAKASKAAKTAKAAKTLAEPIKNVRTKPAARQVGNAPDSTKSLEKTASSFYRTWNPETGMEDGLRAAGKLRDARVASSKKPTASGNAAKKPAPASVPARKPANPARATVKINSAKTVRVVKVAPKTNNAISTSANNIKRKTEPKKFQNIRNEVRQEARANRTRSGQSAKKK